MPKVKDYPSEDLIKKRGKNVMAVRKKYNLSREEFGETIGYAAGSIAMIEQGHRNLPEDSADAICEKFPEIRKEWLLGNDEFMTDAQEYKSRIEQAAKEFRFDDEFREAIFRASQVVILSALDRNDKHPRIANDGESIIFDDYAPTGNVSEEYGVETELVLYRIPSDWIASFAADIAAYAEFFFGQKALNYQNEFEEVK